MRSPKFWSTACQKDTKAEFERNAPHFFQTIAPFRHYTKIQHLNFLPEKPTIRAFVFSATPFRRQRLKQVHLQPLILANVKIPEKWRNHVVLRSALTSGVSRSDAFRCRCFLLLAFRPWKFTAATPYRLLTDSVRFLPTVWAVLFASQTAHIRFLCVRSGVYIIPRFRAQKRLVIWAV